MDVLQVHFFWNGSFFAPIQITEQVYETLLLKQTQKRLETGNRKKAVLILTLQYSLKETRSIIYGIIRSNLTSENVNFLQNSISAYKLQIHILFSVLLWNWIKPKFLPYHEQNIYCFAFSM